MGNSVAVGGRGKFVIEGDIVSMSWGPGVETTYDVEAGGVRVRDIPAYCAVSDGPAPIDWSGPLEAYHPDGRVVEIEYRRMDGEQYVTSSPGDEWDKVWFENGADFHGLTKWRIRNRERYDVFEGPLNLGPKQMCYANVTSREQAERMARWVVDLSNRVASSLGTLGGSNLGKLQDWIALNVEQMVGEQWDRLPASVVDRMVELVRDIARDDPQLTYPSARNTAKGIAPLLPDEPVDPDEVLARKLCDESPYDLGDPATKTNGEIFKLVLQAIRAGRGVS